ncbi:endospore germination permease [Paenibacillus sp. MBLB4367]|uniref:GerAB/ArcD/ProY family transporter n=1 Tax=Paenibacillus sp. MBLB4367 TaxID=3384767 RepID=UPI0039082CFC
MLFSQERISVRQFTIIALLFMMGDSMLYVSGLIAADAGRDAWLPAFIGVGEAALLAFLYSRLGKKASGQAITEQAVTLLGPLFGRAVAILILAFIFIDTAIVLMEIGDFLETQFMQNTPIQFILALFVAVIIFGTRYGIGTLARVMELLLPWFLILFVLLLALVAPQIEFGNFYPMLSKGTLPLVKGNLNILSNIQETFVLLMVFPFVRNPAQAANGYIIGLTAGCILLVFFVIMAIVVLGPELIVLYTYPSYVLAQKIAVGKFLERLEAIMAGLWFITIYVKATISFYAVSIGLAGLCRLRDYRMLTFPLGMILVITGLVIIPSRTYFDHFIKHAWFPITFLFGVLLPVSFLIVAALRKTKNNPRKETRGWTGK